MIVKGYTGSSRAIVVIAAVVVIAAMRLAREVLVPFALAVLLSFLLAPLVIRLQRRIGRIAAVIVVTATVFTVLGTAGWVVFGQVSELAEKLPEYRHNIRDKIRSIRGSMKSSFGRATRTLEEISEEIAAEQPDESMPPLADSSAGKRPTEPEPPTVNVAETEKSPLGAALGAWVSPLMAPLGMAAVVVVFVIFILIYYDDLRDRIIRLIGTGRLNETTQALDDAACRVSRYLLMQTIINGCHGLIVGIGLYFLGLPAALFFGLSSALMRFIPYVGAWIAAAMPIGLALALFDGWTTPLMAIGFFVLLEAFSNNVLEPWLYGSSTGLSPMAVIVAAVFWTWLWGGIGLVLSAPLTVCLVVLGKHVPQFEFLKILLSDQPVLEPKDRIYQRLLAMDHEAALEVAEQHLEGRSLEQVYDEVLLPALTLAEEDRHQGDLTDERQKFILDNMRCIIDELGEINRARLAAQSKEESTKEPSGPTATPVNVLCLPARDEADELAGLMFAQLLQQDGHHARCASVTFLAGEMTELVEHEGVQIVCVSALPPMAVTHARYLWKRLRAKFEQLNIVVGLWSTGGDPGRILERVKDDDRLQGVVTLAAARELVRQLAETIVLRDSANGTAPNYAAR